MINTNTEADNKSLHPTRSSVTPGAISCHALAPGAPAARAGELNRYGWLCCLLITKYVALPDSETKTR